MDRQYSESKLSPRRHVTMGSAFSTGASLAAGSIATLITWQPISGILPRKVALRENLTEGYFLENDLARWLLFGDSAPNGRGFHMIAMIYSSIAVPVVAIF
jgi:hypothetical protein